MQAAYRNVVRWIHPRYESSAWFRLAFTITFVALFNAFTVLMLRASGDTPVVAAFVVIVMLAYAVAVTFVIIPGDWINESEGIGGA